MEKETLAYRASRLPTLMTDRLILDKLVPEDAQDMYAYSRQKRVTKYLLWSPHKSVLHTEAYLELVQEKYQSCEFFDWAVRLKETGRLVGTCGFASISENHNSAEIGYVFSPRIWGLGIATEAARAVIRFGFETLHLDSVTARFMYGNDKSERVMQRLGMKSEGILPDPMFVKGRWRTIIQYRLKREDFVNK